MPRIKFMTYAEKLRDPRWQKRRLEILNRDNFRCKACGDDAKTLNVDHRVYRKGYNPWDYEDNDLQTLCEDCHKRISNLRQTLAERIGKMNGYELERALQLLAYIPCMDEVLIIKTSFTLSLKEELFDHAIEKMASFPPSRRHRFSAKH